ncbi:unknown [Rickettsia bellii RML369-C]|uniref:Uncharacterized protein n=1 Tax=Rickettsia bellii (strain RML369-C) TaxID=336407 RepID=Q1RJH3_RICBR|nr:unknown [Rickettsia bellii RML369-C]
MEHMFFLEDLRKAENHCRNWWSQGESNPQPFECHSNALPTEL